MANERTASEEQLQARKGKIDSVVERINQFPAIGSETILDRHLRGLSGAEYLAKLVQLSEPEGLLDQVKNKLEEKTRRVLESIREELDNQIGFIQRSSVNLDRIRGLVESGMLPQRYLEEARREFESLRTTPSSPISIDKKPEISRESETEPAASVLAQGESQADSESKVEIAGLTLDSENKTVAYAGNTNVLNDDEFKALQIGISRLGEWQETWSLVETLTGHRDTLSRQRLYQAFTGLKKKLGDSKASPRFVSSGMGPKGGKYRFVIPEQATQPAITEPEPKPELEAVVVSLEPTEGFEIYRGDAEVVFDYKRVQLTRDELRLLTLLYDKHGEWIETESWANSAFPGGPRWKFNQVLGKIREKLGETAENPRFIVSSGMGRAGGRYRFQVPTNLTIVTEPDFQPVPESETSLATTEAPIAVAEPEESEDLSEPEPLKSEEVYCLARFLGQASDDRLRLVGVELYEADKKDMRSIAENLEVENFGKNVDKAALAKKLSAFIKDRQNEFLKNGGSDDAQLILAALSAVDTEEQIQKLLEFIKSIQQ